MSQSIDVLLIEPLDSDARKTLDAIHRKAPNASTVRVLEGEQAERLMFERGLFSEAPQLPRLIIADVAATGDSTRSVLRRIKSHTSTQNVPVVIFSATRNPSDILESHLMGVQMSVMKPEDADEYCSSVERIIAAWLVRSPTR